MSKIFDSFNKLLSLPFFQKIKDIYQRLAKKRWLGFIVFSYVVVFLMFFIVLVRNSFTIPVSGDFTLQQIPFYYNGYDDWWASITSGQFVMWDDSGMLGVNNIGANSFYYLFNPFFLVLLLVPRDWLIQAQAFMMITKMVLAGVTMKLLLEHFKLKEETTWLFALAYAFCGWNLYYLWFNHFLEITVLVPLMLLGIEKIIKEQKPMMLTLVLFITGLTNYFFLIAFCFVGVIYAIFRYFQNWKYLNNLQKNSIDMRYYRKGVSTRLIDVRLEVILLGFFAFAAGIMLAGFVVWPCFSVALTNSRVTSQTYLSDLIEAAKGIFTGDSFLDSLKQFFDVLFIWQDDGQKRLLYPLIGFLTINFSCFDSAVIHVSGYDNAYASLYIFVPLMLFLIPSIISAIKRERYSVFIALALAILLLFTPFAYYCFSGFTSVAYARWYIFVIAFMVVFIANEYDHRAEMKAYYFDISFAIIMALIGFMLFQAEDLYNNGMTSNLAELDSRRIYVYIEMVYIVVMYIYLRKSYKKVDLTSDLRYFVCFEAIVMATITVLMGQGTVSYSNLYGGPDNFKEEISLAQTLKEEDDSYFKIFSTSANRDNNNFAMMMGTPGIGTFHSVYNTNLDDFLSWSDVKYNGSWSMGVHEKKANLDEFLGIKYYILKDDDNNVPFGYREYISTDDHTVYINEHFIELGFAFDSIIPSTYMGSNPILNENSYLQGAIMEEEDIIDLLGEDYLSSTEFAFPSSDELNDNITSVTLRNTDIDVYRAKWENDQFVGYEEPVEFKAGSGGTTSQLEWNSYLDVDLSSYNIGKDCQTRGKCFVSVQARMGENLGITLYGLDENDQEYVITHDTHMVQWYSRSDGEWKRWRGFYVDDEVTRMEVKVNETMRTYGNGVSQYLLKPDIKFQYEDSYLENIQPLEGNRLLNVEHGINYYGFDTDYDSKKMVVLQVPYDEGWTLTTYDSLGNKIDSPKIYKTQGGFIGFMVNPGKYHFELNYMTPHLVEGGYLTMFGLLMVAGYQLVTINSKYDKYRYIARFEDYQSN